MVLTCTCSHKRADHQGGKRTVNSLVVYDCMVEGCKCTKYVYDEKSYKALNRLIFNHSKNCALGISVALLISIGFYALVNSLFVELTVTSTETGLDYYNYTGNNNVFPSENTEIKQLYKQTTVDNISALFGFFVGGATTCYIGYEFYIYKKEKLALIFNDIIEPQTKSEIGQS